MQVFSENLFLCQRLSEQELRQIFQAATLYHQDQAAWCSDQYELCTTLQAAIRVQILCSIIYLLEQNDK